MSFFPFIVDYCQLKLWKNTVSVHLLLMKKSKTSNCNTSEVNRFELFREQKKTSLTLTQRLPYFVHHCLIYRVILSHSGVLPSAGSLILCLSFSGCCCCCRSSCVVLFPCDGHTCDLQVAHLATEPRTPGQAERTCRLYFFFCASARLCVCVCVCAEDSLGGISERLN